MCHCRVSGDFQRHEDHDNRVKRRDDVSFPSVRRERSVTFGRQVRVRGHHGHDRGQRAESGQQRTDNQRQEHRAQHQLGRPDG